MHYICSRGWLRRLHGWRFLSNRPRFRDCLHFADALPSSCVSDPGDPCPIQTKPRPMPVHDSARSDQDTRLRNFRNYLDGEVAPTVKVALEMHLKNCHQCSIVYNTTRQTLRIVSESHAFEIPLSVSLRLRARLHELLAGS
jgi:hypothetical protein